uniref:Doublecortin domain-containing protein n=1 Tax=Parastrongyloides trichosuri TaxID=131310 RepID=A0A0N4ZBM9_PARTI
MIKKELGSMKRHSPKPMSPYRKQLSCIADHDHHAKTINIFAAGEYFLPPIRVNVCSKKYRTIDILLDEISTRIPSLRFGARKLVTADDKTDITDIEQLVNGGKYLCSDKTDIRKIPSFDWELYEKRIKRQQNFKTHFSPTLFFDDMNKKLNRLKISRTTSGLASRNVTRSFNGLDKKSFIRNNKFYSSTRLPNKQSNTTSPPNKRSNSKSKSPHKTIYPLNDSNILNGKFSFKNTKGNSSDEEEKGERRENLSKEKIVRENNDKESLFIFGRQDKNNNKSHVIHQLQTPLIF